MRAGFVSVVLFLSGASALLFQTLWLRLSGLAFGNSIWATALILSSFMAGLGLGGALAAVLRLQRLRPLRIYAALELIIAIFGSTLVFGIPHLGEWMRPLFQILWEHQQFLNVLRFSVSLCVLLIPTTAMGLTLPILLADPLFQDRDFGRDVGTLYGFNTLGAVAGALAGEFFLIQVCGLLGTGLAAGSLSCIAACLAWFIGRKEVAASQRTAATGLQISFGWRPPWNLLLVSAGSGAILLGLEVIWVRFLRLYVASSSLAFSIMLAVVLFAIGLGAIASSLIARRLISPQKVVAAVLLLAGIGTLLSYILFPLPPPRSDTQAFDIESSLQVAWLSLALMFPVAFLSGVSLPTIIACVQRKVPNRMNAAGLTMLFNTAGAAVGPLLAGFVLLPSVGFQSSLIIAAAGYVGLAILATERSSWSFHARFGRLLLLLGLIFLLAIAFFPYHRAETHFANARQPYERDGSRLQTKIEGDADTFQLLRRDLFGEPYYYRLVTNSYSMSGTLPRSQRYMRLFAYLPLALRPQSENALLLCYGVGVTADAFTHYAGLKSLDVVDISKEAFDLAEGYTSPGYSNPLRDPRVKPFVQDARFFLQAARKQYDIITGEPPPLKVAGTVNLYTEEFFSLVYNRLSDGGIASFWLPLYQLTPNEAKSVLRAFHNIFPSAAVCATNDLEWIMLGFKPPLMKPTEEASRQFWADGATSFDLNRIGVETPEQMSALFVMDGQDIDDMTRGVAALTDFYPKRLSNVHPDADAVYRFAFPYMESSSAWHRFRSSSLIDKIWPDEWKKSPELYFLVRETRFRSELSGSNWLAELDFYLRRTNLRVPVLNICDSDEFRLALAENLAARSQSIPREAVADLVAEALARRDFNRAIQLLETEKEHGFPTDRDFFLLTYLYCLRGSVEKAEALAAARALPREKDSFVDWLWGKLQAEYGFRPPG
jgi:spermidine synthase